MQGEHFLYNVTPSFDFDPEHHAKSEHTYIEDRIWFDSKSWVSSTIYHLNCSKSVVENSDWSNLATSTISTICKSETGDHFPDSNKNISYIEPPKGLLDDYWGHQYLSVWTLKLFIEKSEQFKGDQFGHVVFSTNIDRLCDTDKIKEAKRHHRSNPLDVSSNVSCAVLKSETVLHVKTNRGVNFFELWYKFCDDTSLFFRPSSFVNNGTRTKKKFITFQYSWFLNKEMDNWQQNITMYYFPSEMFSWKIAMERCLQDNRTLPHFKDKISALDFTMMILNKFDYPTFATFIGLISKVK